MRRLLKISLLSPLILVPVRAQNTSAPLPPGFTLGEIDGRVLLLHTRSAVR